MAKCCQPSRKRRLTPIAPETAQELETLRRSVQRGAPFGAAGWVAAMADRYGLASSLRPRGRSTRSGMLAEPG